MTIELVFAQKNASTFDKINMVKIKCSWSWHLNLRSILPLTHTLFQAV